MDANKIVNDLALLKISLNLIDLINNGYQRTDTSKQVEQTINSAITFIKKNQLPDFRPLNEFLIIEHNAKGDRLVEKYSRDEFLPTPVSGLCDDFWYNTSKRLPTEKDAWKGNGIFEGCLLVKTVDGLLDYLPWETVVEEPLRCPHWRRLPK